MRALAPIALCGAVLGALMQGWPAVLGFLSGIVVVHLWFSVDVLVSYRVERVSVYHLGHWLVVSYVVKVLVGAVALIIVPVPHVVLNAWLLAGSIAGVVVWLGVAMYVIMRARLLYFDDCSPTQ